MKKFISMIICAILVCSVLAGCGAEKDQTDSGGNGNGEASVAENNEPSAEVMPTVINTTEYMLYQNIFFNQQGSHYEGKEVTKKGTFTVLHDAYNSVSRYYVWGYNDRTKCCDWQWEFVPTDQDSLPSPGSLVEVKGIFSSDDKALDGYWITEAQITVVKAYKQEKCDVDMTTMDGTLERVQIANLQMFPDEFENKSVSAYGRIETPTSFQHPYYDNCFSQQFETSDKIPAIGTEVIVKGKYQSGVIVDCSVNETTLY